MSQISNDWIHRLKCCLLSTEVFLEIAQEEKKPWCCPECAAETFSFICTSDND